jgi:hypothetical protein
VSSITDSTEPRGPVAANNPAVSRASNLGSLAWITTKKRSLVTRAKRRERSSGCESIGSLLKSSIPIKQESAAARTVSSKVMGMLAGMLKNGFPLTIQG